MEEIIKKLSEPFQEEAIQRTTKDKTKKGYDTTGIGYQYCVNRFNELLNDKWGFSWEVLKEEQGTYKTGVGFWDITVAVSIWLDSKDNARSCVGGHVSVTYADALKGAVTNGFKKTAAFWGCGRQAYEGSLDDDATHPDEAGNIEKKQEIKRPSPEPSSENRNTYADMLQSFQKAKAILGQEAYYKLLLPYKKANEIKSVKEGQKILDKMSDYLDRIEREGGQK